MSCGSPASEAGPNIAVPTPASAAPAIISDSESPSSSTMNARQRTTSATIAQTCQPQRSTSAPSTGPSTIAGSRSGSRTATTAQAEPKRS